MESLRQPRTENKFGFTYFRDTPVVGSDASVRVTRDEARRLVSNFAKLPGLLGRNG